MSGLLPLFIGTTIFGVGVTIIDILGLLGSQSGESSDDADADIDSDADGDTDTDTDTDADVNADTDADSGAEGESGSEDGEGDTSQSIVAHDYSPKKNVLLKILSVLRNLVYFCFGFGPVGWFTISTGSGEIESLAWAIPVGIVTLVGARLIKIIQRKKLDSQVHESELLMEKAEVLVTIEKGELGKVRIFYGNTVIDRYAKARDVSERFPVGSNVRVISLTDEYVVVSGDE
jgi:membrane protein implicated in regulation of membrane protease activity